MKTAIAKYLARYAEREARWASRVPGHYERVVVVPAYREHASMLDGYLPAARAASGRTLCVVVVNAPLSTSGSSDEDEAAVRENARLMAELRARTSSARPLDSGANRPASFVPAWLGSITDELDLLVVDRSTPPHGIPRKRGVGLARKIGCDLALALFAEGKTGPWIFCTDADARLDPDHFVAAGDKLLTGGLISNPAADFSSAEAAQHRPTAGGPRPAALVYPFWHDPARDPTLTRATALYEIRIRYYVAGLAWAGSPYAMHTLGSVIAIDAAAYAAVRGFPRRPAGEDFYLLGKLAKVGPVLPLRAPVVRLQSRRSSRTPFGTGRGVAQLEEAGGLRLYAPESFTALRAFLRALDAFAEHGDPERVLGDAEAGAPPAAVPGLRQWASRLGVSQRLRGLAERTLSTEPLRRSLHTWFDAFRTLQLIHALRDAGLPDIPWREAVTRAPFVPNIELDDHDPELGSLRRALIQPALPPAGLTTSLSK